VRSQSGMHRSVPECREYGLRSSHSTGVAYLLNSSASGLLSAEFQRSFATKLGSLKIWSHRTTGHSLNTKLWRYDCIAQPRIEAT